MTSIAIAVNIDEKYNNINRYNVVIACNTHVFRIEEGQRTE